MMHGLQTQSFSDQVKLHGALLASERLVDQEMASAIEALSTSSVAKSETSYDGQPPQREDDSN
jgi:hypothetical protein